jgi:hypothetical protein
MAAYDATVPVTLTRIVAALEKTYGALRPPVTDPFETIVLENVAYLVDDNRRKETFERLRAAIGVTPDAILKHSAGEIAAVIAGGGMKPEMRAEKVLECARLATIRTGAVQAERAAMRALSASRCVRVVPRREPLISSPQTCVCRAACGSANTRSPAPLVRAEWGRSIARATRAWGAK